MDTSQLARVTYIRFLMAIPALGLLFFLPAGTLNYWEAWLYMVVLFVPIFFTARYLIKNDPALLERRMRIREREHEQSLINKLSYVYFLITFLLLGFDKRFGWSDIPVWLVLLADGLVLVGYIFVAWVFRTNSYASRVVEVEEQQKVSDTGPYAIVRHPMYLGVGTLYVMSPLALGSYWAMIPAVLIVPILVARILNEEKVLVRDLARYEAYQRKVKKRLLPYVW
jgi:protein-S-isoprenylcysteine O-methyltransferase Ste14